MTILILMALFVLVVVFAVFFLIFKIIWWLFKKNTNTGPLIGAGICTLGCAILAAVAIYAGCQAVISPFKGMIADIKNNPTPIYGQRIYSDDTYPFKLTVYDGMYFSKWIQLGDIQLKIGADTNAFKKDAAGKKSENNLFAVLMRQSNVTGTNVFEEFQKQVTSSQQQRKIELDDMSPTTINGLPAYQASGEAYSNRGKINFWLTALQAQPGTVYYIGAFALTNTPTLAQQAQDMTHSFKLVESTR